MKLRIIQVFDASADPWFRLQQWQKDTWCYVDSDSSPKLLEDRAARMIANAEEGFKVIKEFETETQLLVDNDQPVE